MSGNIFEINKNMHTTTQFCVKKDNLISKLISNDKGVKQGDSLKTTLFNIYINDLGPNINKGFKHDLIYLDDTPLNHLLYTNDLPLMSESSTSLQSCITNLEHYCHKWKLQVNLKKKQKKKKKNKKKKNNNKKQNKKNQKKKTKKTKKKNTKNKQTKNKKTKTKTKVMIFCKGGRKYENFQFLYKGNKIEITDEYK